MTPEMTSIEGSTSLTSKDPEYFKQYYVNNKERMIQSARESYKRQKAAIMYCALCNTSVKKLGYTKHCVSKKHMKNLTKLSMLGGDVEDVVEDTEEDIVEGVYESEGTGDTGDEGTGDTLTDDVNTDVETIARSTDSGAADPEDSGADAVVTPEETKVKLLMTISIQQV